MTVHAHRRHVQKYTHVSLLRITKKLQVTQMPKTDKMMTVSHNQKLECNRNEQTMATSNKHTNTVLHKRSQAQMNMIPLPYC